MKYSWNEDWKFTEDYEKGFEHAETVRIPHNVKKMEWNYCDDKEYQMLCGYQKILAWQPEWEGKRIFITFDGAAHEAEVFLNGESLYKHPCGYTAFSVELTERLLKSDNILTVKLDTRETLNQPPFGYVIDYMTYGGIYREVWLEVREQEFIRDVFVTTHGTNLKAEISFDFGPIEPELTFDTESELSVPVPKPSKKFKVVAEMKKHFPRVDAKDTIFDRTAKIKQSLPEMPDEGEKTWKALTELTLSGRGRHTEVLEVTCPHVKFWDIDTPNLYELRLSFLVNEYELESYQMVFGFRDIEFRTDGFYLNGRKRKLRGLNRHQCYPYVGYAMPESMQIEDTRILKEELGVNAVRTSHYPQSQHFFNACDEMGLLVFTEIAGWPHIGNKTWQDIAVENVRDMIIQNRNHPSIILWGVRINESLDNNEFYTRTNALAHELDPTRPTTGVRYLEQSELLEDIYAYNDFSYTGKEKEPLRPKKKVSPNPKKPYLVSEFNGHMFPTKMWDDEKHRLAHAMRYAEILEQAYEHDEILGCFGWCMFDYNTHKDFGSGDRICYHGILDMYRNPKLAAAVYRSQQENDDFLMLSSNMDIGEHAGGNIGTVVAFTNADSIRLYKNDIFVREFKAGEGFLKSFQPMETKQGRMPHPPICIDDFIGELLETQEGYEPKLAAKVKDCLNAIRKYGQESLPLRYKLKLGMLMLFKGFTFEKGVELFGKYIGNWGGEATVYRIEAIRNDKVSAVSYRQPAGQIKMDVKVSHTTLIEENTYDVASVRIMAVDIYGNHLPYYQEPVGVMAAGNIEVIGPSVLSLKGGAGGCYVRSIGKSGRGKLIIQAGSLGKQEITFQVECEPQVIKET
ncbi:MAG: glycoside hydrolase family 2 protein [Lachnospiraceae bacterium]|nr:glycoside hydrolase family 2 protein [Lachnospiraceae bacterium]